MIDAHAHVYAGDPHAGWEQLSTSMATGAVASAVVIQPSTETPSARWLDELRVAQTAGAVIPVGPRPDQASLQPLVAQLAADERLSGLRLTPLTDPSFDWASPWARSTAALAARHSLVLDLLVHPGQLRGVGRWLEGQGNLRVVIDHVGRLDLDRDRAEDLLALAVYQGCAVKLSALSTVSAEPWPHPDLAPVLSRLLDAFGPDRLMWGSDFPYLGDGTHIASATALRELLADASPSELAALFGGTARRWFAPDHPRPPDSKD